MSSHIQLPMAPAPLLATLDAQQATFAALRQAIHAHPETAYEEQRTAALVARELARDDEVNSQRHILRPTGGREPWGAEHGPAICCEILPITLTAGQICYLRRRSDGASGIWHEPHTRAHPSETVRARIESFLGTRLDPRAAVVHSTAWRYECGGSAGGRLILTYLVALAPIGQQPFPHLTTQISLEPVGVTQPARSEALIPPARISLEHVLAHALDHLTLLMETDVAIQAALGEAWRAALCQRLPRPAGELCPVVRSRPL